jgi:hypothetical protein
MNSVLSIRSHLFMGGNSLVSGHDFSRADSGPLSLSS